MVRTGRKGLRRPVTVRAIGLMNASPAVSEQRFVTAAESRTDLTPITDCP